MSTVTINNPPLAADYERTQQNLQHTEAFVNGPAAVLEKPGGGTRKSLSKLAEDFDEMYAVKQAAADIAITEATEAVADAEEKRAATEALRDATAALYAATAALAGLPALAERFAAVSSDAGVTHQFETTHGGIVAQITEGGGFRSPDLAIQLISGVMRAGSVRVDASGVRTDQVNVEMVNRLGGETVVFLSKRDGVLAELGPGMTAAYLALEGDDTARYAARDAANVAAADRVYNTVISNLALPPWHYTLFLSDGQSESVGLEAWPPVSLSQYDGNVSIGTNVDTLETPDFDHFYPVGNANPNPLVASMMTGSGVVQSDATMSSGTGSYAPGGSGTGFGGEHPVISFVNGAKKLRNRRVGSLADAEHIYGATSVGISGFAISGLSKSSTRWTRKVEAAARWKAIATAAGKTSGLGVVSFIQGVANLADQATAGGSAAYQAALAQYWSDVKLDIAVGVFGQADMPPLFIYATSGGTSTVSSERCGIANAQRKFANENPSEVFVFGPKYMAPHKGVHLHPQGSAWWGAKQAQVYDHVVHGRRQWRCLQPLGATISGKTIAIDMLVPRGSLQIKIPPYFLPGHASASVLRADLGFGLYDIYGSIPIVSGRIVGSTIVELTALRKPIGDTYLTAADDTRGGYTNICDSDDGVATATYDYRSGAGMYAETNVAELVGKPFPMNNWLVPFGLKIQ